MKNMQITLWDVGHGLSIWIKTPKGHNHWIDAGKNADTDFHLAEYVFDKYDETEIDFLIISHPDSEHIEDLPNLIEFLREPRAMCYNRSLPDSEKFGSNTFEYQKTFKYLVNKFRFLLNELSDPKKPDYNGGICIETEENEYVQGMKLNDTSVVSLYLYKKWLFIFPGDIEESGWSKLWKKNSLLFTKYLESATYRILVAPHHGRESGYSLQMFENIKPHLTLICDKYGQESTDRRFRENPIGLKYNGEIIKYMSTKNGGRIKFEIDEEGKCSFDQLYIKDLL